MNNLLSPWAGPSLALPRANVTVRPGVLGDVPFLDSLQKLHTKQVGWMPTKQFEGKVALGHVLVAEEAGGEAVGYCIGNDQYFKRDDVGIIYQMNVLPGKQRAFVGAALLQAMFDRSAYGCRLYCCWCAQDIAANQFWEAMGFVPLAFRAGSRTKGKGGTPRVHIFWQKRIRQGDTTTPWWFPSQTGGGSIREDRIVLPIPPGTHWSDAKPMILPGMEPDESSADVKALPAPRKPREAKPKAERPPPRTVSVGGLRFTPLPTATGSIAKEKPKAGRAPVDASPKRKNNPRLVAAARELRDRWLERINQEGSELPPPKYAVGRLVDARAPHELAAPAIAA